MNRHMAPGRILLNRFQEFPAEKGEVEPQFKRQRILCRSHCRLYENVPE